MWRIYYDNGSVFTSEDGTWDEAPLDGVLFVLQKVGDRILTQSGCDHYVMEDDTVVSMQDLGPLLRKMRFIKFGRWTSIKKYEAMSKQVAEDAARWQR